MKIIIGAFIFLFTLSYPVPGNAATLYLNDGRIIQAESISEEEGLVKCRINGITISYTFEDIDRIEGAGQIPHSRLGKTGQKGKPATRSGFIKSCYELGYRYGSCAARRHDNLPCEPKNDIVIPERCRGKSETEKGMVFGIAETDASQNTQTNTSPLISIESISLEALEEYLVGRTKREVKQLAGSPRRVEHFAGHELWIYGDTNTSSKKAVAFEGEVVKSVVFY